MSSPASDVTRQAIRFVEDTAYPDLSTEALRIGRRSIVDAVGLYLAGSQERSVRMPIEDAIDQGGRADVALPAAGAVKVPAPLAARVWGTAGHAHDLDAKFRMCAEGVLGDAAQGELLSLMRRIDQGADLSRIMDLIAGGAV